MTASAIASLIYGSIVLIGGIFGYIKAKSLPSLISGAIAGVLLLVGTIMQVQGIAGGRILSIGVALLLIVVFLLRLRKTKKFMPSGLMVAAGIACLALMLA